MNDELHDLPQVVEFVVHPSDGTGLRPTDEPSVAGMKVVCCAPVRHLTMTAEW